MGKLDDMMRDAGANVGESMGAGRVGGLTPGAAPRPSVGIPARLQGITKAKDAAEIPVDKIQPDPDQPREEFDQDSLGRLADSLKTRGQLQPIRVRWVEERQSYVIIAGERRWRAGVIAGLRTMTCVIHDAPVSSGELLALQLIENMVREDLKPIEQARAFRSLQERNGWSVRQLARELAIDHTGVSRALALLELPAAGQASVEQGDLPAATAYELSKVDDPAAQERLAEKVLAEGLSRAETIEAVHRAPSRKKKGKPAPKLKPTTRSFRIGAIKITAECRRGLEDAALADALEQAARDIRQELDTREVA